MPRTTDGEPKRTAGSGPRPSPCGSDRRFSDAAPRVPLPRQKPLSRSPDSVVAPMAGNQQSSVDADSSDRWLYFAIIVCFIATIATFGMLIWQVARAFR